MKLFGKKEVFILGEMKEFTEKAFIQNSSQININQKKVTNGRKSNRKS